MLSGVDEPKTADATCIARVWMEHRDPVLRGRIRSTLDGPAVTARGVDDLTAALRDELDRIELALVRQLDLS
jgi:hypothetical protein